MHEHKGQPVVDRRKGAQHRTFARVKAPPTPGEMAELHRKVVHSELTVDDAAEYPELKRY